MMKRTTAKRALSFLLSLVMVFSLSVYFATETEAFKDYRFYLFNSESALDIVGVNSTKISFDAEKGAMKIVSTAADPFVRIAYSDSGISADSFKYITVIYETAKENTNTSYTQVFLSCAAQTYESPDACVSFNAEKGSVAYEVIDLSAASYWKGDVYNVRLDIFQTYTAGEYMYLYGIGMAQTRAEAESFGEQFVKSDALSFSMGDTDKNGTVVPADAAVLCKYLAGSGHLSAPALADINEDGKINALDSSHLKKILVGVIEPAKKASLSLGEGRYVPGSLEIGSTYSISGCVSSDFVISEVTAKVTDKAGNTVIASTAMPQAHSYLVDSPQTALNFASLSEGEYRLQIVATDEIGTQCLADNPFTICAHSTLSISSGSYDPVSINQGASYAISGTVTSNYVITSVVVGVYNKDGTPTAQLYTGKPNSKSFDIATADSSIKFGSLASGDYYFEVAARDTSGNTKLLVANAFTVVGKDADVKAFQQKALSEWIKPVRAKILSVVGTGRGFGAYRTATRQHAGIDYYVSGGAGTPVYAMQSGTVVEYLSNFYYGTSSVAVQHADGSVARYCEISTTFRVGDKVEQGQQIATIIGNTLDGGTMLHLELYMGTATGSLSRTNSTYDYVTGSYNRRRDILNPEFLLNLTRTQ